MCSFAYSEMPVCKDSVSVLRDIKYVLFQLKIIMKIF